MAHGQQRKSVATAARSSKSPPVRHGITTIYAGRGIRHQMCSFPIQVFHNSTTNNFWIQENLFGSIQKVCHRKNPNFCPPSPLVTVCHHFPWPPSPPCHHPNSDKLFDSKLAKESLGLCLTEYIRVPKSHRKATEKQN